MSNTSAATVPSGSTVTITNNTQADDGGVTFNAEDSANEAATAQPAGSGASGNGSFGIGASIALDIGGNTTLAELANTAQLTGANNLTFTAGSSDTVTTDAVAGSAGASLSISPSAAITLVTNTTQAQVGTPDSSNDPLSVTGAFSAAATHTGQASTTSGAASGSGSSVSAGVAIALAIVTDQTTATTGRSLIATGGGVAFLADGSAASVVTSTASASGGPTNTQESQDPDPGPADSSKAAPGSDTSDPNSVDGQDAQERDYGDSEASTDTDSKGNKAGAGDSKNDAATPTASTSDGGVTVAAAVAVNIADNEAEATIPDGLSITAAGPLTLTAANGTGDSTGTVFGDTATASGTGAGTSRLGVGAAVALNLVKSRDMATIGAGTTISAQSVALSATMHQDSGTPEVNTFGASATAGAGATDVGVAGALGINLVSASSEATIGQSYASPAATSAPR